jgi:hypothetical protein
MPPARHRRHHISSLHGNAAATRCQGCTGSTTLAIGVMMELASTWGRCRQDQPLRHGRRRCWQADVPDERASDEAALSKLLDCAKRPSGNRGGRSAWRAVALLLKLCWQSEVRIGCLHGLALASARVFYTGGRPSDGLFLINEMRVA